MRALAGVGMVILLCGAGCASAPAPKPKDPRLARAEGDNERVEKIIEDMDFEKAGPEAERVAAWIEAELGPAHPAYAQALSNLGALRYYGQDIAGAKALFERALAIQDAALPKKHPDRADSLANLGAIAMAEQDHDKARKLYTRALAIRTEALGPDHPDVGDALHELAYPLLLDGEHERALELYRRALAIWEKALGPTARRTGQGHLSLGMALSKLGRSDEANREYEQALAVFDQVLPELHPQRFQVLQAVAMARWQAGRYSEARPLFEKLLAIQERQLGPEDPRLADLLDRMGGVRAFTGDYAGAAELHRRALALREKAHGPDHPAVAGSLYLLANQQLALAELDEAGQSYRRARRTYLASAGEQSAEVAYCDFGLARIASANADFSTAQTLYQKVQETFRATHGDESLEVASVLAAIGQAQTLTGDYPAAQSTLEQALAIQKKLLGPEHPHVARTLASLGQLATLSGDYDTAVALLTQALGIITGGMYGDHPDAADLYGFLADARLQRGQLQEAVDMYQLAIQINEAALGKKHLKVITALHNQAHALALSGAYEEAVEHYTYALQRYESAYGKKHPWAAQVRCTRALIRTFMDQAAKALPDCRLGLKALQASLGKDHPWMAANLRCLMLGALRTGDLDTAKKAAERALAIANQNLDALLAVADNATRARVVEVNSPYFHTFVSIHDRPGQDSRKAYDAVLRWKGRVLQAQLLQQATLRDASDPAVRQTAGQLADVRRKLSTLIFSGLPSDPAAKASWLEKNRLLSVEQSRLERELARSSSAIKGRQRVLSATGAEVCRALGPKEALVDFIVLKQYEPPAEGERSEGSHESRYQAFVLLPGSCASPIRVDLGPAEQIDEPVQHLKQLFDADANPRRIQRQLRRLWKVVWEPIEDRIGRRKRIWLVPDGFVALLPFGVLQDDEGSFLIEKTTFGYLSSAQELVRLNRIKRPRARGVLALGAVVYGPHDSVDGPGTASGSRITTGFLPVPPLPGTKQEIDSLRRRVRRLKVGRLVTLEGGEATEARLVEELPGKRFIHLATHGFFSSDQTTEVTSWSQFDTEGFSMRFYYRRTFNEMARNGLVLAGANASIGSPGANDNLLSAVEVAGLDLSQAELVTLSACDTGVGNILVGEGVLGLRRAFAIAGARALVISLWRVPDEETRILMEAFYRRVFRRGADKVEALRAAKLEIIEKLRAEHGRADPRLWAAFILSGR